MSKQLSGRAGYRRGGGTTQNNNTGWDMAVPTVQISGTTACAFSLFSYNNHLPSTSTVLTLNLAERGLPDRAVGGFGPS